MKKLIVLVMSIIFSIGLYSYAFAANEKLEAAVIEAVKSYKTELDVSSFNVDPESALKVYFDLYNTHPDFTYAEKNARCEYMDNKAVKLYFAYKGSVDEIKKQKAAVEAEINNIVKLTAGASDNAEKIKIVHDYIVGNSTYDYNFMASTPYDVLVKHTGICVAYAVTFKMVMDKLNIPCDIAVSSAMGHEWNVVQIGADWYNVDLTYDAISHAQLGGISYSNSLKSDSFFSSIGYRGWTAKNGVKCVNTNYDEMLD